MKLPAAFLQFCAGFIFAAGIGAFSSGDYWQGGALMCATVCAIAWGRQISREGR